MELPSWLLPHCLRNFSVWTWKFCKKKGVIHSSKLVEEFFSLSLDFFQEGVRGGHLIPKHSQLWEPSVRNTFPHQKWSSTLVDLLKLLPSMFRTDGALIMYLCWEEQTKCIMFYLIQYTILEFTIIQTLILALRTVVESFGILPIDGG